MNCDGQNQMRYIHFFVDIIASFSYSSDLAWASPLHCLWMVFYYNWCKAGWFWIYCSVFSFLNPKIVSQTNLLKVWQILSRLIQMSTNLNNIKLIGKWFQKFQNILIWIPFIPNKKIFFYPLNPPLIIIIVSKVPWKWSKSLWWVCVGVVMSV